MQEDQGHQKDRDPEVQGEDARETQINPVSPEGSDRGSNDKLQPEEAPDSEGTESLGTDYQPGAADDGNYGTEYPTGKGIYGDYGGSPGMATVGPGTMSPMDEKNWSMLSHLSILVSLVTGIGGVVAALVIWLVYKDRSPRVGFHALQSLWYQVAWAGIFIAFGVVGTVLSIITFGLAAVVMIPLGILLAFVPFVHQIYAAIKVNGGEDYRYPIIADMIDGSRRFDRSGF